MKSQLQDDNAPALGYSHPAYVRSFGGIGVPRELAACGAWIIERSIPGCQEHDGMGCYPLFVCRDWGQLPVDLAKIGKDLVTLALVTDPFADVAMEFLQQHFDIAKPFKAHYVADLGLPMDQAINRHHRYYARRSLRTLEIEVCVEPIKYFSEWIGLYGNLIERHQIRGIRSFSEESFQIQLTTPGMVMIVGKLQGEVVGAHLVAVQNLVAYSHLAAFSAEGYRSFCAYGVYQATLEYLAKQGVRYFDLGAAAGLVAAEDDGLDRFKRGWSSATRMAYFCGKVFAPERYDSICRDGRAIRENYFPSYRSCEY